MFMMVGTNNCPACGVEGNVWMKKPVIYRCPKCNSLFSEFGVVARNDKNEKVSLS